MSDVKDHVEAPTEFAVLEGIIPMYRQRNAKPDVGFYHPHANLTIKENREPTWGLDIGGGCRTICLTRKQGNELCFYYVKIEDIVAMMLDHLEK